MPDRQLLLKFRESRYAVGDQLKLLRLLRFKLANGKPDYKRIAILRAIFDLSRRDRGEDYCVSSVAELADVAHVCTQTARRAIRELRHGSLLIVRSRDGDKSEYEPCWVNLVDFLFEGEDSDTDRDEQTTRMAGSEDAASELKVRGTPSSEEGVSEPSGGGTPSPGEGVSELRVRGTPSTEFTALYTECLHPSPPTWQTAEEGMKKAGIFSTWTMAEHLKERGIAACEAIAILGHALNHPGAWEPRAIIARLKSALPGESPHENWPEPSAEYQAMLAAARREVERQAAATERAAHDLRKQEELEARRRLEMRYGPTLDQIGSDYETLMQFLDEIDAGDGLRAQCQRGGVSSSLVRPTLLKALANRRKANVP